DRPFHRPVGAVEAAAEAADVDGGVPRDVLPRLRAREEAADRGPAAPVRLAPLRESRAPRPHHRLGGGGGLLAAALLRLLGLLRHGGRAGLAARLPVPAELRLALQGREHLGLLAPLAHQSLVVVPGL